MSAKIRRRFDQTPAEALAAVGRAVELWGAGWQAEGDGGQIVLPVVHGLRHELLEGRLVVIPDGGGCLLELELEEVGSRLNRSAVAILLLGAVGGLSTFLWPLFPGLLRLAPAGFVLAVVAWLLVASRLRSSDADDFLSLVADLADPAAG